MLGEGAARHGSVAVPGGECAQHVGGVCEVAGHQVQGWCGHEHECAVQDVLARGAPVDELRVLGHSFGHGRGEVGDEWDYWIAPGLRPQGQGPCVEPCGGARHGSDGLARRLVLNARKRRLGVQHGLQESPVTRGCLRGASRP